MIVDLLQKKAQVHGLCKQYITAKERSERMEHWSGRDLMAGNESACGEILRYLHAIMSGHPYNKFLDVSRHPLMQKLCRHPAGSHCSSVLPLLSFA